MVFAGTWFAASQPSESDKPAESEEGVAAKTVAVLKTAAEKTRPVAAKAGEMIGTGAKKAATATSSGAKWLTAKFKDLLESRRGGAAPAAEEQAKAEGEGKTDA